MQAVKAPMLAQRLCRLKNPGEVGRGEHEDGKGPGRGWQRCAEGGEFAEYFSTGVSIMKDREGIVEAAHCSCSCLIRPRVSRRPMPMEVVSASEDGLCWMNVLSRQTEHNLTETVKHPREAQSRLMLNKTDHEERKSGRPLWRHNAASSLQAHHCGKT